MEKNDGRFKKGHIPYNKNMPRKTHCKRGHELVGENLYWNPKDNYSQCRKCQAIRREINRDKIRIRAKEHYHKYKKEISMLRRIMHKSLTGNLKKEILIHYGNGKLKCMCCNEDNIAFLTIDHINNNGNEERKIVRRTGHLLYRYLKKNNYPQGYQTLCFNCNSGRAINKGICPHKTLNTIPVFIKSITITRLAKKAKEGDLSRLR